MFYRKYKISYFKETKKKIKNKKLFNNFEINNSIINQNNGKFK